MTVSKTALVVGGGSIGRRHTQNLQQLDVDVAIAEPSADVRHELVADLGVTTFSGLSEALESITPEFVIICAPNNFHVELALEAAEAGSHIFIEKPISHEMGNISDLKEIIKKRDLISLVGCNLRFQPEVYKMYELLQKEVVGSVVAARIEAGSYLPEWFEDGDYRESYSAREDLGGGVILDFIHEINYARWFFDEFKTVSAIAGQRTHLDIETNDVAGILAETRGGTICEFHLDYVQQDYSRSCHIVGEKGTIRWSWADEQVDWYVADEDEWHTFKRPTEWTPNDMYLEEMKHFLTCVKANEQTICPVECGRRDLAVGLAARESASTGQHVQLDGY